MLAPALQRSLFFKKEMELALIGLQNAGKTSLVNVIANNDFHEDMIPTVGFNMRKVTKGAITIKLWDLGGQVRHSPPFQPTPAPMPSRPASCKSRHTTEWNWTRVRFAPCVPLCRTSEVQVTQPACFFCCAPLCTYIHAT